MRVWRGVAIATGVAAAVAAGAPPAASAASKPVSRAAAARAALRILAPSKLPGAAIVYESATPLAPSAVVFPAVIDSAPASGAKITVKPLGQRGWLFYEDMQPGARFEHPVRVLVIAQRTGATLLDKSWTWWPEVNGQDPPFVTDPHAGAYQVFDDVASNAAGGSGATPADARAAAAAGPIVLPANSLKGECVVEIGLMHDKEFAQDFAGVTALVQSLAPYGLKGPYIPPTTTDAHGHMNAPGGQALRTEVNVAVDDDHCTDVLVYIDGHGSQTSPKARVLTGNRWRKLATNPDGSENWQSYPDYVTSTDLAVIMRAHPTTGFKFKIDSCYSGRFITDLPRAQYPNLVFLETASSATEVSWSYLGKSVWVKAGMEVSPNTPGATEFPSRTDNPGNTNTPAAGGNATYGRGEFTNGNLYGLSTAIRSPTLVSLAQSKGGSLFGQILAEAFTLSSEGDLAHLTGLTTPMMESNLPTGSTTTSTSTTTSSSKTTTTTTTTSTAAPVTFGSLLTQDSTQDYDSMVDTALWAEDDVVGLESRTGSRAQLRMARENAAFGPQPVAHEAATTSGASPVSGVVTQIVVRGYYKMGTCPTGMDGDCEGEIHFQDLRPQTNGSLLVVATTSACTIGDSDGAYTFNLLAATPTCGGVTNDLHVQTGDYVGFSTIGGDYYVLVSAPGAQTGAFSVDGGDMNGSPFGPPFGLPQTLSDVELNMQVTVQPSPS